MELLDRSLDLITKHWKMLIAIGIFFVSGGYLIARYRTSGMRRMLSDHNELLDELNMRLNDLRLELDNTRQELSKARAKGFEALEEVERLSRRVAFLEANEAHLLEQIQNNA